MLQQMRRISKSWVSSVLLGGLAVSFALWGIADIFRGNTDTTVFSVGSTSVPVESFSRDYKNATRNIVTALTPEQSRAIGKQVLERMILSTALDNLTARLGLTASDARVRQEIQAVPAFAGALGTFDHDNFLRLLQQAGYSEQEFVELSRRDAARAQLLRGVEGAYAMPADYARAIFAYVNEQRAVEYVTLTQAALPAIAPPTDAVLAAYVKAHPETFSAPEYRTVGVASIGVDDIAASINVTPQQIKQERDSNPAAYTTPEKREIEQISFKSEDEAKAAKAQLDGGKSFEALAAERKLKPADYKLGELSAADLAIDPERQKAAFALAANATSGPVKSAFGWVILHVGAITPGSSKSDDDVKKIVQQKLAVAKITDMANALTDALAGGANLDEAARKSGFKFAHVAAVDAKGLAPDGSKVPGADNPELLTAVFKAEVGEDGDPFPTKDGHYFAIKVDGVTPPKLKPLDAVRDQALAKWSAEQRATALRAKAQQLTAAANGAHSLAPVASAVGAPVQKSAALTRGTKTGVLDAALVKAIYAAAPGAAVFSPAADGNIVIARVTGIAHPAPPSNNIDYVRGVQKLSGEIASDFTVLLARAERDREGASINQKLVDSTVGGAGSGS